MLKSERSKVLYLVPVVLALSLQSVMARKLECGSQPQLLLGCPNFRNPFLPVDTMETRYTFFENGPKISNIIMFDYPGNPPEAERHLEVLLINMDCTVLILYSRSCEHSARMAPHVNAVARVFPNIYFVAVDVFEHQFIIGSGPNRITGTPSVLLLQSGVLIGSMYEQEGTVGMNVTSFATILERHTDQIRVSELKILPRDYEGPIPTVAVPAYGGYDVIFCWIFIVLALIYLKYIQKPFFDSS